MLPRLESTRLHRASKSQLSSAVLFRRREHVNLLTKYGANLEARGNKDYTTLHLTIRPPKHQAPDKELIRELIEFGVDVNATTVNYDTGSKGSMPLHLAAARLNGSAEIIVDLLQVGARIDQADEVDYNSLHMAVMMNHVGSKCRIAHQERSKCQRAV